MPTILIDGYKFRSTLRTNLNHPVRVLKGSNVTKIWLQTFKVEYNRGYNTAELNKILRLMRENHARLMERWNEHFGQ